MSKTPAISKPYNPYLNHTFFRSRKFAWLALLGGSVCVGSTVLLGNTILGRWMKFIVEDTRNGKAIVPSRKLRPLKDIVMSDLKLPETSKVKLFSICSDFSEVYGSINSYNGAFVGIPSYLNFEEKKDLSPSEELSPSVEEDEKKMIIEKYLKSFELSENAKLYIIAEGIALAREPIHFLIPSLTSSLCFLASFLQGQVIVKYCYRGKSPAAKCVAYSLSGLMWLAMFMVICDRTNMYVFEHALKCLNSNYIDGGIEYYQKAVTRNEIKLSHFAGVSLETRYLCSVLSDRLDTLTRIKDKTLQTN